MTKNDLARIVAKVEQQEAELLDMFEGELGGDGLVYLTRLFRDLADDPCGLAAKAKKVRDLRPEDRGIMPLFARVGVMRVFVMAANKELA